MKNAWHQSVNFIKKLKENSVIFPLLDLKIIAYMGLLIYWSAMIMATFFTIELKVTKGNKVKFSPHQIAFHIKHPHNTFIMVEALGSGTVKLFRGSRILELVACGLELEACCLGLEACGLLLETLGA